MPCMKKRILVLSLLLLLASLIVLFFALRPTISDDEMVDVSDAAKLSFELQDEREKAGLLDFEYEWELNHAPNNTLILNSGTEDAFALLQPASWKISCRLQEGKCILRTAPPLLRAKDSSCQVRSRYLAEFSAPFVQRHPDGTMHPVRIANLVCEVWIYRPFFQKPLHAFAIQEIKLDIIDGSADIIRPIAALMTAKGMKHHFVANTYDANLPSRYCGTERERIITRILFSLASIDSKALADTCTPEIVKLAQQIQGLQIHPDAPWPDCWGDDAPIARQAARRIIPTLVRMQENDCYGNQELIDFINSESFSRIFGEDFSSNPSPLQDMPPIIFEKVENEKN